MLEIIKNFLSLDETIKKSQINSLNSPPNTYDNLFDYITESLHEYVSDDYLDKFTINNNYGKLCDDVLRGLPGVSFPENSSVNTIDCDLDKIYENVTEINIKSFYANVIKELILNNIIPTDILPKERKVFMELMYYRDSIIENRRALKVYLNYFYYRLSHTYSIIPYVQLILNEYIQKYNTLMVATDTIYIERYPQKTVDFFAKYDLDIETINLNYIQIIGKRRYIKMENGTILYCGIRNSGREIEKIKQEMINRFTIKTRESIIDDLIS